MLSTFRARTMKGLSRRTLLATTGAAAALLVLLPAALSGASPRPANPCDPTGTWKGHFQSTSTNPTIFKFDTGEVTLTVKGDDNRGQPGEVHFEWKTDEVTNGAGAQIEIKGTGVLLADKTFTMLGRGTISSAPPGYDRFRMQADGSVSQCNTNNNGHANRASATEKLVFANDAADTVEIPQAINETYPPTGT
jgi:hypothetical protein